MPLPTRLVCGTCLESIEASVSDDARPPRYCPACGSSINRDDELTPRSNPTSHVSPSGTPCSFTVADAPTPGDRKRSGLPLERIGRFRLGEWIGGGGYGDVYIAFDPRLERNVALKVLKLTKLDAKATERFLREARAAARLDHPFIVGLHDAGEDDGRLWIAYQLVRGRTLSQLRDARALSLRAAVALVRDLAEALHHAHLRGVFHRDLKPANVLVDDDGRPHLTDFGLARRLDLASELTGEGTVLGTPAYMSPEQAAGRANLADARSDIYSLGVILYELICGRRPADVPSDTPLWKLSRPATPPPPNSIDRAIPHELDQTCMKALALNPDDRPADALCFARALDAWLDREAVARPRRRAAGMVGATLALVAGLIALGVTRPGEPRLSVPSVPQLAPASTSHIVLKPRLVVPDESIDADAFPVVVNTQTHKVHLPGCSTLHTMSDKNREEFASLDLARRAGHGDVCKTCARKMPGL